MQEQMTAIVVARLVVNPNSVALLEAVFERRQRRWQVTGPLEFVAVGHHVRRDTPGLDSR